MTTPTTQTLGLPEVKKIHAEVTAALKQVLEKHGFKLGSDRCKYDSYSMKFSIEALKDDANAMAERANQMFRHDFSDLGIAYGTILTDRAGKRAFKVEGITRTGKIEARDQRDAKIYTGKPESYYLNGKQVESKMMREMKEREAKYAAERADTTPEVK